MAKLSISKKQSEFLQSKNEYVILSTGIGFGKTFIAAEKCVHLLLQGAYIILVAQSYKSLKMVLFAEVISRLRYHRIEYDVNKSDMTISVKVGNQYGMAFGFSGDDASIENVRGITADCAILDECALLSHYAFDVIFGRLRRGVVPMQTFAISSPRGKNNYFYTLANNPNHHVIFASTMDNPFLPSKYVKAIKNQYEGIFYEQEILGKFVDVTTDNALFDVSKIIESQNRLPVISDADGIIAGLDVARFGDDDSALVIRQGSVILHTCTWNGLSLDVLRVNVLAKCTEYSIDALVVDSVGLGGGFVDEIKNYLHFGAVKPFNSGYKPDDSELYYNSRAEVFDRTRKWVETTGVLPKNNEQLINELKGITYSLENKLGKMLIESKEAMRLRKVASPNLADALAMTFVKNAKKIITKRPIKGRRFSG